MARYKGPRVRISRKYGVPIFGPSKYLERRAYPPGVHGPKKSRRKQSDYGIGLAEKQKLRYQYGLLERQFRRLFEIARKKRGVTGETLLQLLETRLDNVVYLLGFASTRPFARQVVNHGHIRVNGRKTSTPSSNSSTSRWNRRRFVPCPGGSIWIARPFARRFSGYLRVMTFSRLSMSS